MGSPKTGSHILPILSLLYAGTTWGIVWYPLRLLEEAGLAGLWSALVAYGATLVVSGWFLVRDREQLARRPWALLAMGLAAGWCNIAFILAVLDGTVVRVLLLFYLSPIWTVVFGRFLLDERMDRAGAILLAAAMVGALIMLWDPAIGLPWPRDHADWLALSSGMAFALTNVLARKLDEVSVAAKTVVDWLGVFVLAGAGLLLMSTPLPDLGWQPYAGAVALGIVGFMTMTLAVVYGVSHMPVHRSAVILLFELVAGAASAYLLTDETVLPREWLGGGLIVLAAYLAARREAHT